LPGSDVAPDQYDLFDVGEAPLAAVAAKRSTNPRAPAANAMADDALCASIVSVALGDAAGVLGEVAHRRLASAVPHLAALIRRFKGFETRRPIIEQTEALGALVAIGGLDAAAVLRSAIERGEFNRANLGAALRAAAQLGIRLEPSVVEAALSHDEAEIRLAACAFASARPNLLALLLERLADQDEQVRVAATCALGDLGRIEARPLLLRLLQISPTVAIIEAAASVADEAVVIQLGKLAREQDCFRDPVIQALEDCDMVLAAKIRRDLAGSPTA
jgi:HEAT repeat protein